MSPDGLGEPVPDAYELIRTAIVENRYEPGQRLVEQRIAEEFGLSRTPVREALRRLEAEGLVVAERNRGARVRRHSRIVMPAGMSVSTYMKAVFGRVSMAFRLSPKRRPNIGAHP